MIERPVTATKEMSILKCMDKMRQYTVEQPVHSRTRFPSVAGYCKSKSPEKY